MFPVAYVIDIELFSGISTSSFPVVATASFGGRYGQHQDWKKTQDIELAPQESAPRSKPRLPQLLQYLR
jgi:hypothetical protein